MLITALGKQKLEEKIKQLNQELDRTSQDKGDAATEGDLKENSAYIFLGERADVLRTQIQELTADLKESEIAPKPSQTGTICFGHQVTVNFQADGRQMIFTLVGKNDSPLRDNWLSVDSPVGIALIGKHRGDQVQVNGQMVTIQHISLVDID